MSDREESQMPETVATGASTELPAPTGNRPAQDARQVHATNQIDGDWHGGDDATDFLGLDLEVAGAAAIPMPTDESTPAPSAADAQPARDSASNSWLLSLDEAQAAQHEIDTLDQDPTEEELDPAASEADVLDPNALDEDPLAAQGALTDASWPEREAPRKARGKGRLVAVSIVVLAAAAFGAYQFKLRSQVVPDAPLVAQTPASGHKQPVRPPKNPSDAHGGATQPPVPVSTDAHTTPLTDVVTLPADHASGDGHADAGTDATAQADAHGDVDLATTAGTAPAGGTETAMPDGAALDGRVDPSQTRDTRLASGRIESWLRAQHGSADADSNPDSGVPFSSSALSGGSETAPNYGMSRASNMDPGAPSEGVESTSQPALRIRPSVRGSNATKGGLRRATAEDLAGIWEGSVIPMDAIPGPSRLLTPGVGRVRVLIHQGEIFEGLLYAVGQSRIWLDTDVGRLALLSQQVLRIEHLSAPSGATLGAPGSQELAGLPRVRVRTPGGTFYGKAIARDDITVTLITDEGARVMLESRDVEAAPLGVHSVVIKPSAKR
jgi:hypothetical protein